MTMTKRSLFGAIRTGTFLSIASSVLAWQPLTAQSFTTEQVMSSPFPQELISAGKGSSVAWVFNLKGADNVWVASGPSFTPRQISALRSEIMASPSLLYNSRPMVALRSMRAGQRPTRRDFRRTLHQIPGSRSSRYGPRTLVAVHRDCSVTWVANLKTAKTSKSPRMGEWVVWAAKHELWIAPISGSVKAKQLTDVRGDVSTPQWSPDSQHMVMDVKRRDHSFIVIADIAGDTVQAYHYIAPSVDRDIYPQWSPDGEYIAFIRVNGQESKRPLIPIQGRPWSLWIGDPKTYSATSIWRSGNQSRDSLPHFAKESLHFAAGHRVVFDSEQDGWNHLYSVSATGGMPILLTRGEFDVEDVSLSADGTQVLFSSNEGDIDRRHLWRVNVSGGDPQTALTQGETIEWTPVETGDGKSILCLGSTATSPALVYQVVNGKRELITKDALPNDFPSDLLVVPKQVIFKSEDGYTIHGQLFVPRGQTKPGPALIFTHGGPSRQMLLGFHYLDAIIILPMLEK